MQKITQLIMAAVLGMTFLVSTGAPVAALDCGAGGADKDSPACKVQSGVNQAGGKDQAENCKDSAGKAKVCGLEDFIKNIIDILLFLIGAIAVIMIIIGGIRYVTSNGDSSQTTAAKNTILYAVVGLVIAVMAYAIVNWVIGSL